MRNSIIAVLLLLIHWTGIHSQIVIPSGGCISEDFDVSNPWTFGILGGSPHTWTWANPNKATITDDITGGGNCLILGGNTPTSSYNASENSWAQSPEYDLSAVGSPYIEFWFFYSNEPNASFDEIWMEYSTNNGASWSILSPPQGSNNCYDQNWYNYPDNWGGNNFTSNPPGCFFGGVLGGGPTGWIQVRKCVANDIANEPSVRFRFRIQTGTGCEFEGATIDNFTVCDAAMVADFDYTCTGNLQVDFTDLSETCPDGWSWDFGDGNSSTAQNPSHTYAAGGVYTVTLQATASSTVTQGCGGPFSDNVSYVIEVLGGSVTVTDPSCNGDSNGSASLTYGGATSGETIVWNPVPGGGQGTTNATGLSAGTYNVTVTPANPGCPVTLPVPVTNPAIVSYTDTPIDPSCGTNNGSIDLVASGGTGAPYNYSIDNGTTTQTSGSFTGLAAGTYDILVEDGNGCTASSTITLTNQPAPTIDNLSFTDPTCGVNDGTITITASGGAAPLSYSINAGVGFQPTGSFTGLTPGVYPIVVEDANGCQVTSTANLIAPPAPVIDSVQVTEPLCAGSTDGSLEVFVSGGSAPINYSIDNGTSFQTDSSFSSLGVGTYDVVVEDATGCQTTQSVTITDPPGMSIIMSNDTTICDNGAANVSGMVTGGAGGYTYSWTCASAPCGLADPTISFTTANPAASGYVYLTVTDVNGCSVLDSLFITVNPAPVIDAGSDQTIQPGGSAQLQVTPAGASSYNWTPVASLDDPTISNPVATPANTTQYIVEVTESGCTATDSVTVFVQPLVLDVIVPTMITPDGDGANDTWVIDNIDQYPNASVQVYNRWGSLIFESNGNYTPWDGTYNNNDMPGGSYFYVIDLNSSAVEPLKGTLSIIR